MLSWLVPLWVFLLPIQVELAGFVIPRFAPADLLLITWLPFFIARDWRTGARLWHPSVPWLVACFLLANWVTVLRWGEISRYALLNKTVGLLVLVLSYAMVAVYAAGGWQRVYGIVRLFVRVVTLHALLAIVLMALGLSAKFHANFAGRLSGYLVDPNAFGGLLVAAFTITLVAGFRRGALFRPFEGAVSAAVLAVGTVLTYSRSCWLGLVAGAALGMLMGRVRHRALAAVTVVALGAVVYYTLPAVLETEVTSSPWEFSGQMATRQTTIEGRADIMDEAVRLFLKSPIWGQGLGGFQLARGSIAIVHNTFLWFLVEFGVIGAAVFAWFLVGHARRSLQALRRGPGEARPVNIGLLCGFVAMAGLSLGVEALYQRHWWFIMAVISAAWLLARSGTSELEDNGAPQYRAPLQ
ncbi:O-antigen ligase family protein [candidate division WOR-3 bacterium]|nr:O-antigen ligase family protein [candidate division WOR-3 bacterium]